jgi:hypothetical protein
MQDPSDTTGRLIAADEVQGTTVYNRAGEKLGSLEDLMIDKMSGKACYGQESDWRAVDTHYKARSSF